MPIAALEALDAALVIGSHLRAEQPLLNHRLRKAWLRGAGISVINPRAYDWNFDPLSEQCGGQGMIAALAALADACGVECDEALPRGDKATAEAVAASLRDADKGLVLLGALAQSHPSAALIRHLASGSRGQPASLSASRRKVAMVPDSVSSESCHTGALDRQRRNRPA